MGARWPGMGVSDDSDGCVRACVCAGPQCDVLRRERPQRDAAALAEPALAAPRVGRRADVDPDAEHLSASASVSVSPSFSLVLTGLCGSDAEGSKAADWKACCCVPGIETRKRSAHLAYLSSTVSFFTLFGYMCNAI